MYCPTYHVIYRRSPLWLWRKRLKSAVSTMRGITRNRDMSFQTQTKLPLFILCETGVQQHLCTMEPPATVYSWQSLRSACASVLCCKHCVVSTCLWVHVCPHLMHTRLTLYQCILEYKLSALWSCPHFCSNFACFATLYVFVALPRDQSVF